ncbi:MAG: TonB-dependent receptor [Calditrichaeota bacterium]|nr:MAG: TonB-dependent receptor [Calditrichota bacterium]
MKRGYTISMLVLLTLWLGICWMPVQAQNTGRIVGVITDATTGDNLPGAIAYLEGTVYGATTDRYGVFLIDQVPFGSYTLKVSYIGYKDYSQTVTLSETEPSVRVNISLEVSAVPGEEVEVVEYVRGQMKALSQQLNSANIKNVLSREEMERFPDMNTAEVLQRIPGVAIQRSLGEGRFVYLRGTEPRLTTVEVDGEPIASPQDEERFVGLDVINSSQLAYMEVVKALTPDMDGDAIGGVVNLITHSAFDYPGQHIDLDLGSGYSDLPQEPLYRGSLSYSNVLGENRSFGLSINANWYRNNIGSHSDEMDWDEEEDVNGNPIPFALTDFRMFNYDTRRDHLGLSSTLEYRVNDNNRFFVRGMYNQRNDDQVRNMIRFRVKKGDYLDRTTISKARLAYEMQARDEVQKIYTILGGGKHQAGRINLDYTLSYSYAEETKKDPGQIKSEFQLDEKVDLKLDLSDVDFPGITVTNLDPNYIYDPSHWEIDNQDFRETFTSNKKLIGSLNLQVRTLLGNNPTYFKLGGKLKLEDKDRNSQRFKYKWRGADDILMSQFAGGDQITGFLEDHYTFAPIMNADRYWPFFEQFRGQDDGLREEPRLDDPDGAGGKYNAGEDIFAGYAMATLEAGNFTLLAGVRDEFTKTNYEGVELLYDDQGEFLSSKDVKQENSYNNVFPALHIRYRVTPLSNLRFAVTTGISRPNYFDLAPYRWVFPEDQEILRGNPELEPTTSLNFDLMFEHYFRQVGGIALGVFYKSLDKIIYPVITRQQGGPFDGFFVEQPVNGGKAKLYGFEIGFTQQLTFLPGALSGLGIFGNYTYTKSEADLTFRPEVSTLPGQAGDVGNVGISYDKYGFTARLSANYTSDLMYRVGDTPDFDRFIDDHLQIDFSAAYQVVKGVSLYVQMINLNNEPKREYFGEETRPRLNEFYSWWMRGGLKITR